MRFDPSKDRSFAKTSSGRKRYNTLGALNWIAKGIVYRFESNPRFMSFKSFLNQVDNVKHRSAHSP